MDHLSSVSKESSPNDKYIENIIFKSSGTNRSLFLGLKCYHDPPPTHTHNLARTRVIWKEESTAEEMSQSAWLVWACLWVAFSWLMIYM